MSEEITKQLSDQRRDISVELNLARHVSQRFNLKPPVVKLIEVVKLFANVEIEDLPVDVDGACLDLKRPGKRPTILINKKKIETRRQFTLAHELGHVLIPSHFGDIAEEISVAEFDPTEAEANRFASELLLPTQWAQQFLGISEEPGKLLTTIASRAKVSLACAAYKLPELLGPGYVFAEITPHHKVKGAISWANAPAPSRGAVMRDPKNYYKLAKKFWTFKQSEKSNAYCWWQFKGAKPLTKTILTASDVLRVILSDCAIPEDEQRSFLGSIGGVAGGVKRNKPVEEGVSQLRKAFEQKAAPGYYADKNRVHYQKVLKHARIDEFFQLKVPELIEKAYWLETGD